METASKFRAALDESRCAKALADLVLFHRDPQLCVVLLSSLRALSERDADVGWSVSAHERELRAEGIDPRCLLDKSAARIGDNPTSALLAFASDGRLFEVDVRAALHRQFAGHLLPHDTTVIRLLNQGRGSTGVRSSLPTIGDASSDVPAALDESGCVFSLAERREQAARSGSAVSRGCCYFFSHLLGDYQCLSQFYPCTFVDSGGVEYSSAEQFHMLHKASLFRDMSSYRKIMLSSDPAEIKRLGRKVAGFNQELWERKRRHIVTRGNYLKFSQNEALLLICVDMW
jgi:predicted NAD-dependent protein-ADP-ribosyltransferase YbiA (DUF1768 family)